MEWWFLLIDSYANYNIYRSFYWFIYRCTLQTSCVFKCRFVHKLQSDFLPLANRSNLSIICVVVEPLNFSFSCYLSLSVCLKHDLLTQYVCMWHLHNEFVIIERDLSIHDCCLLNEMSKSLSNDKFNLFIYVLLVLLGCSDV